MLGIQSVITNLQNTVQALNAINKTLGTVYTTASNTAIYTYLNGLPTTNPGGTGNLWWNAGVLTRT